MPQCRTPRTHQWATYICCAKHQSITVCCEHHVDETLPIEGSKLSLGLARSLRQEWAGCMERYTARHLPHIMKTQRHWVVLEMDERANGISCEHECHASNLVFHGHQRQKMHESAWQGLLQADRTTHGAPGLSQHLHGCIGRWNKQSASMCCKQLVPGADGHLGWHTLHPHWPSVGLVHNHHLPWEHKIPHCMQTLKVTICQQHTTRPGCDHQHRAMILDECGTHQP